MGISKIEYNKLIKDLGGSIAQNRFKFQRFWAINEIYNLYKSNKEFTIIFDYVSDIDIFINDDLHFYQVKTNKNNNFTIKKLIKIKKKNNHSILSKLAILENNQSVKSLNIVSNTHLSEKDKNNKELQKICLDNLKDEIKNQLKTHIEKINKIIPNLSKYFYIKSDLCLDSSYKTLLGNTVTFLENNFGTTSTRATLFLDWLLRETENRSTYEYEVDNIDEVIIKKGITKEQFSKLLADYNSTSNELLSNVNKVIDQNYNFSDTSKLASALTEITRNSLNSNINKTILEKIRKYILQNEKHLTHHKSERDVIEEIVEKFNFDSVGYNHYEKKCLIIIGFVQFKEGVR
ncbi:dsDNA nuclease domain-containing protein [Spiroplasma sp. AdecLV25b]|uniref:dsDNA nuclease domain-containing protein n=1 Tax=Spiroplasma sp. AdecLV25b TaxID=3027162 RepID=UPI0027E140E6|nr:dsDNA nuclease domain-containing protein [Spiroplasma sp. AdecLV25b]